MIFLEINETLLLIITRTAGGVATFYINSVEETAAAATEMGDYIKTVNEVVDYQIYVGAASPFNFNGLVRHYYPRQ